MGKGPQKEESSRSLSRDEGDEPRSSVKIAHITDVHISAEGRRTAVLKDRAAEILTDVLAQINEHEVDLTVFGGDNIDNRDGGRADLDLFLETTSHLDNWRCILGNHEAKGESNKYPSALTQEAFLQAVAGHGIGPGQTSFSESLGNVRLIALNTTVPGHHGGKVDNETFEFLKTELANASEEHIIIFGHHLLTQTWAPAHIEIWDQEYLIENAREVRELLLSYPNVRAYLCGHHHASHISFVAGNERENGFYHILTPSLSAFPHGARILTVTDESLIVETVEPRLEGLLEEGWSAVLGGRKIQRFETLNHPRSFKEYVGGSESDRNVCLPIERKPSSVGTDFRNSSTQLHSR